MFTGSQKLNRVFELAMVFAASFLFFAFLQSFPTVLDPDTFYHLKVAQLIMEHGFIDQHFPWLAFTTLAGHYADQHLLYHLALIPFVKFLGPMFGGKLATVVFGAAVITALHGMMRAWKVSQPWIFALLALTNYHLVFRLNLIKASGLAIFLLLLGMYLMVPSETGKKFGWARYLGVAVISMLYMLAHGGFIILPAAAGMWIIASSVFAVPGRGVVSLRMRSPWAVIKDFFASLFSKQNLLLAASVLCGLLLGLVAHPDRRELISFLGQQLIQIGFFTKVSSLRVGSEWFPFPPRDFFLYNAGVLLVYLFGLMSFFIRKESRNAKSFFLMMLSLTFLIFTIRSKRFIEYFVPLAILFSAVSLHDWPLLLKKIAYEFRKPAYVWAIGVISLSLVTGGLLAGAAIDLRELYNSFRGGHSFYEHSGGAKWLAENTPKDSIVFNSDWDIFPPLFFFDDHNRYIVGLDPTFMYDYNPNLMRTYDDLILGRQTANLKEIFLNDFQSKYIYVAAKSDTLRSSLLNSGEFIKLYEDKDGIVFSPQ